MQFIHSSYTVHGDHPVAQPFIGLMRGMLATSPMLEGF